MGIFSYFYCEKNFSGLTCKFLFISISALLGLNSYDLQYSFPPSCVGEVGRIGAPSRREIGHGMLAERSLEPILPLEADFPYTIRVESTITESNGSSRCNI